MEGSKAKRVERRLSAILAADVAGYSRLMGADEEGTLAALKAIRRELGDPKVEEHRGRMVKTMGDGLLIEFASVVEAVGCALAVQRGMSERNATIPEDERIIFRVGITGQLIDTASGSHIWADHFDGALDDIFDLQDRVAASVVGAIEPKLRLSEIERAGRKPTDNLNAYDLYLRALALRDAHTDESVRESIVLLKQALAIDPGYAPAKALIGWSRQRQFSHGRSPVSKADAVEAVAFTQQALEGGKDDPDVLWMAACVLLFFAGEREVAAAATDRALTLNPNSAHAWMARGYASLTRPDAAIEAFEHAMRLNPLDRLGRAFTIGTAIAHLAAGRYEEALAWAERTLREEPGYSAALRCKAVACAQLDRMEEAREAVRQAIRSQPELTIARAMPFYSRICSPEAVAIYTEGLRKTGLPEE